MKRGLAALIACFGVLVIAGCGSSSKPASGSSAASSSATSASTASTHTSSLKVAGTPKYGAPTASAPVQSGLVQIAYRNIAINPDTIKVKVGSTIKWTNYDAIEHNVTSEGGPQKLASKTFGEGESFEIKASRPGVIHYLCTIHPASMNGTIDVVR